VYRLKLPGPETKEVCFWAPCLPRAYSIAWGFCSDRSFVRGSINARALPSRSVEVVSTKSHCQGERSSLFFLLGTKTLCADRNQATTNTNTSNGMAQARTDTLAMDCNLTVLNQITTIVQCILPMPQQLNCIGSVRTFCGAN